MLAFICFVFAGAIIGVKLSDRLRAGRDCCREIHAMLTQICVMIRYRSLDVYEIIRELHTSEVCGNLEFLRNLPDVYEPGTNFHDVWDKAVSEDDLLSGEERSILLSFGSTLGTSDADGQISSAESAIERIRELERIRSEEYSRKGKLYRSVGMLFGTMVGILII